MKGWGLHSGLWSWNWTVPEAEATVVAIRDSGLSFDSIEVLTLNPAAIDVAHSRRLLEGLGVPVICTLGLPADCAASSHPDRAADFLCTALETVRGMGAIALTGLTYGPLGERTGRPPSETELDNVARSYRIAAEKARALGMSIGIEVVNRYESHLVNTAAQAAAIIERVGADNIFIHLDTYHLCIEEQSPAQAVQDAGAFLRYIHLSESTRGMPGAGCCDFDALFAALKASGFNGGLVPEAFCELPDEIAAALALWRPTGATPERMVTAGIPWLRQRARAAGLPV
ncbi:sugar phosphate isomerase/epimerase family protein [Tabrizicola sp. M-4]|uniref:sugar phosphate isomerase/epimerase family protein n=1 Tax=Tabrizicola sp. M-4 TaxID=3055847 RepID=UPI003DA7AAA3